MTTLVQRLWWVGLVAVLGVAWLAAGDPGAAESATEDAPAARTDSVRVKHELVRAGIVRETPPPVVRHARLTPPASRRPKPAAEPHPTLGVRAMRVLVGDGRYRPQPFPTVK